MERRSKQPNGRTTEIPCRKCATPVVLDPRVMRRDGEHWLIECPECGHSFAVRLSDPFLPVTPSMDAAAREERAKPKGSGKLRKFLVGR